MPRKIRGKTSAKGTLTGDNFREPPIRWRKRDLETIEREITNFNKRLYRQQKKNDGSVILPSRQSKTRAVESIKTRAEFNRFISDLKNFNAKTAKTVTLADDTKITQWQRDKTERDRAEWNKDKVRTVDHLNDLEIKQGGKGTGTIKKYGFGDLKEVSTRPDEREIEKMKADEFFKFADIMEKRLTLNYKLDRQRQLVENYLRGLIRVGFSDDLINLISTVPPDKFLEIIESDVYAQFSFIYDPIELAAKEEQIRNAFAPYASTTSYWQNDDIEKIAEDVVTKLNAGYYGRDYENRNRKYHWKRRK